MKLDEDKVLFWVMIVVVAVLLARVCDEMIRPQRYRSHKIDIKEEIEK